MGSTPQPNTYSASQVSTLIGLGEFSTPLAGFQTMKERAEPGWNAAHGYTLPPAPDNAAIRLGLAFEDSIIKLAEEKEGCEIWDREEYYSKEKNDITLSCHIDGQYSDGMQGTGVIMEGKTTNHWAYSSTRKEIIEKLGHDGQLENGFNVVRRWGDPGTNEVPQEYQIQAAVQRICTGAELVKLSVLVFPQAQQAYEDMGWEIVHAAPGAIVEHFLSRKNEQMDKREGVFPMTWARILEQMGNFHTYLLPSAPPLEQAIIKAVQSFHVEKFLPGIPPSPTDWDDVRRLLPNPIGTVIATPTMAKLAREHSELTRSLGTSSPASKRREIVRTELMGMVTTARRSDATHPQESVIILDPFNGDQLASLSKNKNGVLVFRSERAR